MNKNKFLNLNIASYFLNILDSPYVSTWSTTCGPINKTIKHLGLNRHYQNKVERTRHMVHNCKEMKQEYTGNNCTRHLNPPYILSNPDELNILADAMENRLRILYATHLVNCRRLHNSFDSVCKSTVNLASLRLQPKITRI